MKYSNFNLNESGGPTQAELGMKPEIDVTGSLVITRDANAVIVISTFVAKYVADLELDFLLIGGECKTSRWVPSTWGWPQELIEGICGIICLGAANDCIGTVQLHV